MENNSLLNKLNDLEARFQEVSTLITDPAVVADRERNEILVMSVCGNRVCWHGNYGAGTAENPENPNRMARLRIKYNEETGEWEASQPKEVTYEIYPLFKDKNGKAHVGSMFIGAGRMAQSSMIKVGDYYRIYCAVLVKNVNGTHVNFVLYSDDFGQKWTVLGGGEVSPIPGGGDEPKADELPDGSVIISSRTTGGRYFNIFTYTDSKKADGSWGTSQFSGNNNNGTTAVSNSTNGEILFVPARRKADDKKVYLALQSVPLGSGRANVGIYYKELETKEGILNDE